MKSPKKPPGLVILAAFLALFLPPTSAQQRIISLAPSLTELIYALGAEAQLVGTMEQSNTPEAAKQIPRIGNHSQLYMEALLAQNPSLILVWQGGTNAHQLQQLAKLNIQQVDFAFATLEDIALALRKLGEVTQRQQKAEQLAQSFEQRLAQLQQSYGHKTKVKVFFQVWDAPLMTINQKQWIHHMISNCGGENVFAQEPQLVPQVSVEGILAAQPQVFIAAPEAKLQQAWLSQWQKWPLEAAQQQRVIFLNPEQINRPSLGILDGMEDLCQKLDGIRQELY